jgi:hypothetical protein
MMGGPPLFPQDQAPRGRGRKLGVVALLAVLVGGLVAASQLSNTLFAPPRRRPAPAALAVGPDASGAEDAKIFQVVSSDGQVDAFRDGRWLAIHAGDLLTRDDLVRTAPGARAVLRLSAGGQIELRERVEIRLDRLSAAGSTVDLRRGKVVARVGAPRETLAITARETLTSTEGPADVVVQNDENGLVSVAALKGSARFAAGGKTVALSEGTETRSQAGAQPSDPEKIPEEVLLQVVWPEGERHGEVATIEGRVAAASHVSINGTGAAVGADGRFSARVPLREGGNKIAIEAEDLMGRRREAGKTLTRRPTRPPKLAPVPTELWKK